MHVTEVCRVAAQAWAKVKPADDPDFNSCQLSFREQLVSHTEGVIRTGTARTDFEKAAKEVLDADGMKAPEPETEGAAAVETPAPKPAPTKAPSTKKSRKSTE